MLSELDKKMKKKIKEITDNSELIKKIQEKVKKKTINL